MKKTLILLMAIVLGLFLCVSCDMNKTTERNIPDGLYSGPKTATYTYFRFNGTRVIAYDSSMKVLNKGDYVLKYENTTLSMIWDSGKTTSWSISWPYKDNGLFLLGSYQWQYSRIDD